MVVPSAGEAALGQERQLLGGAGAAEQRVAMREAAEALDDIAVAYRILQDFGAEVGAQREAVLLVRQILGVPEGQVEKEPEFRVDRSIVTSLNSNVCLGSR